MRRVLIGVLSVFVIVAGITLWQNNMSVQAQISNSESNVETQATTTTDVQVTLPSLTAALTKLQGESANSPNGIQPSASSYQAFWQLFNVMTQSLGSSLAFEHYRATSSIFLAKGAKPAAVGAPTILPAAVQAYAQANGIASNVVWHNLDSNVKVSGLTLKDKWNQDVRYALRMSDPMLGYILANSLYNLDGISAVKQPIDFPLAAMELKTSWIWIDDPTKLAALKPLYYIANAYFVDGQGQFQIGQAALSGFHMVPKLQPGWVWTTFENINNPLFTQAKYQLPIDPVLKQVNSKQQQQLSNNNSVFAHYQLNGIQTAYVNGSTPLLLANSQIESKIQNQSSCKTCHSLASFKLNPFRMSSIVDPQGNGISYYIGNPPDMTGWASMDFAWSLKRAQWIRP